MTAKEMLKMMPQVFNSQAAANVNAVIQYDISEPIYHVIKNGTVEVHEGQADNPNVTITVSDSDLVKLLKGELNGMTAFMSGKLKLKGDMMLAQRLASFVDRNKLP
jgi:putative sterol carrier protein